MVMITLVQCPKCLQKTLNPWAFRYAIIDGESINIPTAKCECGYQSSMVDDIRNYRDWIEDKFEQYE